MGSKPVATKGGPVIPPHDLRYYFLTCLLSGHIGYIALFTLDMKKPQQMRAEKVQKIQVNT